ncbi:MAG: hypothetical protein MUQ10_14710 [Anaerolineae bacterium]|nr:hypothetical protein [Anaerolineae bacterium]
MAPDRFPFNVPASQSLGTLCFSASVTFFVGESGAGKSTLLQAIVCAAGPIGLASTCAGLLFGDCGVGDVARA